MGRKKTTGAPGSLFHLILPGRRNDPLVQGDAERIVLGAVIERVLWWCGGLVHGFRCEGREIRFALELSHTPVWAMAHRISAAYGRELGRRRGWRGGIFSRYIAIPVDAALHRVALVAWLHRSHGGPSVPRGSQVWTGHEAYLTRGMIPWVTTARVLDELGRGTGAVWAYRDIQARGVDPKIVTVLNRRGAESDDRGFSVSSAPSRGLSQVQIVERIARALAAHQNIPYRDLYSKSRRREFAKAKTITAVLAVRHGASLAAVASVFGRDSSTLIEEAARYREREPSLFEEAEAAIAGMLHSDR